MKKVILSLMFACISQAAFSEEKQSAPLPVNPQEMQQAMQTLQVLKPFLVEAIRTGESHTIMGGPIADYMKRTNISIEPLYVNVTTILKYKQPGCARLNVQFLQNNVTIPGDIQAHNREINFQLNYCTDGHPPKDEGKEYIKKSEEQLRTAERKAR